MQGLNTQSLDTDVQRPFLFCGDHRSPSLLEYGKRPTMATLNKKGVAYRYQATVSKYHSFVQNMSATNAGSKYHSFVIFAF